MPSGRDIMRNFMYYHVSQNLTINDSAQKVYEQLVPFWLKSHLPTRRKDHVLKKIKDMHAEYRNLMRNQARGNAKDLQNQKEYSEKLDKLFDISHAASDQLLHIEEDKQFLKLQQESRSGVIGSVDKKKSEKDNRAMERKLKIISRHQRERERVAEEKKLEVMRDPDSSVTTDDSRETESDEAEDQAYEPPVKVASTRESAAVLSPKLAATLDRTNTSVRSSTMIIASVVNEAADTPLTLPSKSTVHRHRQQLRCQSATRIKQQYKPTKSVVHWDGKLISDITDSARHSVDRLPVLLTSAVDGSTKLLGVPALPSGTGQDTSQAVYHQLQAWNCEGLVIGMTFDTTASNSGRKNGACQLLENMLHRNLLWLPCRHHMHEVLLSDIFTVCFGPSSGPEIALFKRFREMWDKLESRQPQMGTIPLIAVPDDVKLFISQQLAEKHSREDYLEFLQLAGIITGLQIEAVIRRPGAIHRARWMAKALYTLKIELLHQGNENMVRLTGRELQAIQRFNRFVVTVYIEAWFTCSKTADAPVNDLNTMNKLNSYDDRAIRDTGLKWMARHSWYLSPEMATLAIFSSKLESTDKAQLVSSMTTERGPHLVTKLPSTVAELRPSRSFFQTSGTDDHFLSASVEDWPTMQSFQQTMSTVNNLPCINDCAERGVALIETFNSTTKDESQKQYLLQVVEQHRKSFTKLTKNQLSSI